MAENKIINRVKSFLRIGETKSAPDFGQNYLHADRWASQSWRFTGWNWFNRGTTTTEQYQKELGPLDGNSLVMCVVNYTGTRLPEAKPTVTRYTADGKSIKEPNHRLAKLIRRPNQFNVWSNYCLALSLSWWIDGNVYFLKDRDITGQVQQLWYIPHFLMRPRWYGDGMSPAVPQYDENGQENSAFISHYQYDTPGKASILYPAKDIVHIKRGINLGNPRKGLSAFEPLITELYGDNKMAQFTAQIMKNMGLQVPVFSPKDKNDQINEMQAAEMRATWMAKTTGERAGEPVIQSIPIDMEKFGFSPTELDLSKLRMIPESRVAAVTGIPAATLQLMVGLENGSSYASSEQARQQGYEEVVIPIQQSIQEEITWQLMFEFEKNIESVVFEFDTSEVRVLQEDRDALYKRESDALRSCGQTINQYLVAIGKDAIEGGDVFLLPLTSRPITAERLAELANRDVSTEVPPTTQSDIEQIAKMADVDRAISDLNAQMDEFMSKRRLQLNA